MNASPAATRAYRLPAIDVMRGLVIVIMALDHVRDMFMVDGAHDPTQDPNVGVALFLTRWITHFCAPVFALLAGTSAGLMAARKTPNDFAAFLVKRGLWLIALECFVISTALSLSPLGTQQLNGSILIPMQVLWVIGASMIVLAGGQYLGHRLCLLAGTIIVLGHNLLDPIWPASSVLDQGHPAWVALHSPMSLAVGPFLVVFVYPLLPWIGVMFLGYGIAPIFEAPPERRNRALLRIGIALTAAFFVIRAANGYGDPHPWRFQPDYLKTLISFLNTTKYPPSLQFLLMTLGPAAIVGAFADRMYASLKAVFVIFGRVPLAFYVLHFFVIHGLSVLLGVLQGFEPRQLLTHPIFYPPGYGVPLFGVYLIWILIVALLYPFCRWYADVKARRKDWWLSYL